MARDEGERHYRQAYGRKVVVSAWLTSLRERRRLGSAFLALLALLGRDAPRVGSLVVGSARRRLATARRSQRRTQAWATALRRPQYVDDLRLRGHTSVFDGIVIGLLLNGADSAET